MTTPLIRNHPSAGIHRARVIGNPLERTRRWSRWALFFGLAVIQLPFVIMLARLAWNSQHNSLTGSDLSPRSFWLQMQSVTSVATSPKSIIEANISTTTIPKVSKKHEHHKHHHHLHLHQEDVKSLVEMDPIPLHLNGNYSSSSSSSNNQSLGGHLSHLSHHRHHHQLQLGISSNSLTTNVACHEHDNAWRPPPPISTNPDDWEVCAREDFGDVLIAKWRATGEDYCDTVRQSGTFFRCYRFLQFGRGGPDIMCDFAQAMFEPSTGHVVPFCQLSPVKGSGGRISIHLLNTEHNHYGWSPKFPLPGSLPSLPYTMFAKRADDLDSSKVAFQIPEMEIGDVSKFFTETHRLKHIASIAPPIPPLQPRPPLVGVNLFDTPTFFIHRDCAPPYNPFHCMTTIADMFQTLSMMRLQPGGVRCIFLDKHPLGNFELLWKTLCASYYWHKAWSLWNNPILIKYGVFVPTSSYIWTDFWINPKCRAPSPLLVAMRRHFLVSLEKFVPGLQELYNLPCNKKKRITFFRRPHSRKIANEDELVNVLNTTFPDAEVFAINPGTLPFEHQVALMQKTDVLVGMHGGALTNLLYLPSKAVVVELHPHYQQAKCYMSMALRSGLQHVEVVAETKDRHGKMFGKLDPSLFKVNLVVAMVNKAFELLH